MLGEPRRVGRLDDSRGEGAQVRVVLAERGPGARIGGQRTDLEFGVLQRKAQELTARITARTGHSHGKRHAHNHTPGCIVLEMGPAR